MRQRKCCRGSSQTLPKLIKYVNPDSKSQKRINTKTPRLENYHHTEKEKRLIEMIYLVKTKSLKHNRRERYQVNDSKNEADSSSETTEAKRQWSRVFKVPKERKCPLRVLYPAKTSVNSKG